jgi:signal transduction histidine kinase
VVAREEERRRLQRDLHDELGPTLASMSMQLDAARAQLWDDPAAGEALLAEVQSQLREAIGTVRQIVHQLRPPILDQLGLCGAVGESAMRIERGAGVRVRLELPAALPPMSAAVEAAAYYIVAEALNNMARHARARNCTVRLSVGTRLQIEVADDGVGLPVQISAGIGLRSMRERALEVGGVWAITDAPSGGTIVRAGLPLTP